MIASQYVDYDDKKICAYLLNLRHLRAISLLFYLFVYIFLFISGFFPKLSNSPTSISAAFK